MRIDNPRPLTWEGVPQSVSEFVAFRKLIKEFKDQRAVGIIRQYFSADVVFDGGTLYRYFPQIPDAGKRLPRTNLGVYSTALCLEALGAYRLELATERTACWVGAESASRALFLQFLVLGIEGRLDPDKGGEAPRVVDGSAHEIPVIPRVAILEKIYDYLDHWGLATNLHVAFESAKTGTLERFQALVENARTQIDEELEKDAESLHPYVLYKFLKFASKYQFLTAPSHGLKEFESLFDKIYLLAKYELYRQMALKSSNDAALYDPKRLGYSLLVVTYDSRFSNNQIRDNALKTLFETQRKSEASVWPTGQLLPTGRDSSMAISGAELARDLVHSEPILPLLGGFLRELKSLYDFHARTVQVERPRQLDGARKIKGWYPPEQRDKTPASFVSAMALSFIKGFCQLISRHLSERASIYFQLNRRSVDVQWNKVLDSTAAKGKLRMLIDSFEHRSEERGRRIRSALLFGPPGTGKTSLARAVAQRLNLDYLELTPGDFFSGGEQTILQRISDIFENLQHLHDAVVFIDEIDDLVRDRQSDTAKSSFDPRALYVNTLLPRFQELRDRAEIVLILSTNRFENVDPAIRRLGRIDLLIPVGPLSAPARLALLAEHLQLKEIKNTPKTRAQLGTFLAQTERMTYSQLRVLVSDLGNDISIDSDDQILKNLSRLRPWKVDDDMNKFCNSLKEGTMVARPSVRVGDLYEENLAARSQPPYEEVTRVFLDLLRKKPKRPSKQIEIWLSRTEPEKISFDLIGGFLDQLERDTSSEHKLVQDIKQAELERKVL
jgi:DNA polymerase III delta prime subunit